MPGSRDSGLTANTGWKEKGTHMTDIELMEDPEAGMATAEYAVGTVAATSFAGILIWLFEQGWFKDLISDLFRNLFNFF